MGSTRKRLVGDAKSIKNESSSDRRINTKQEVKSESSRRRDYSDDEE